MGTDQLSVQPSAASTVVHACMMLQSASPKSATNSDAWPHFWKHGLTLYLSEDLFAPPPCTLLDEKHVQALTQTKLPRPTPSLAQILFESCTGVTGVGSEDSKAALFNGSQGERGLVATQVCCHSGYVAGKILGARGGIRTFAKRKFD